MPAFKFIVFEGIDGSGKSTQSRLLTQWFRDQGLPLHETFEPTGNFIGSRIRDILTCRIKSHPITVANLFAADRYNHLTNEAYGICRHLREQHVICDRYLLSSYAYQGLDAPMEWIRNINKYNEELLWPDLTFYLRTDEETALKRITENREQTDLFETRDKLRQIAANYDTAISLLSPQQRAGVHIIDAAAPPETIAAAIRDIVAAQVL